MATTRITEQVSVMRMRYALPSDWCSFKRKQHSRIRTADYEKSLDNLSFLSKNQRNDYHQRNPRRRYGHLAKVPSHKFLLAVGLGNESFRRK